MKVAFYLADQNPHRDRTRGITVYTDALLRALASHSGLELSTLTSRSSYRPEITNIRETALPFRTDHTVGRLVSDQLHPLFFQKDADIWHYPKGYLPFSLARRKPILGTCHDVILQHYADHYPRMRPASQYAYWLRVLRHSLSRFDTILTVSEFSKSQILQFCERHKIRTPEIVVTVEGTAWENFPEEETSKENFVLHLGSLEPHKGTARLLNHWRMLEAAVKECPRLLIVGDVSPADLHSIATLKNAEHRPPLSRPALTGMMRKARALILPSEIEGFGLPAIEAFAALTPVIFGKSTSVAEIVGTDSPGAYDLPDFESFREAVDAVLGLTPQSIFEIRNRLALKYTWAACAETTVQVYRNLVSRFSRVAS